MKTKNLKKKLVLSKTTVSDLQNVEMKNVHGGSIYSINCSVEISWCELYTLCRKCPIYIPESEDGC